jgi:hypothetical protein
MPRCGAACLAVLLINCFVRMPTYAEQSKPLWDHGSHTQPSPDERALRALLARYGAGDVEGAVRGVLANGHRWIPATVDAAMRRTDEEIAYHRRSANRLSAARDERLERYLRADRLNLLLLAAALQLEGSHAVGDVDTVGRFVVGSERMIDRLYALRADFDQNGPLPWPIHIDQQWDSAVAEAGEPARTADWPAVHTFVCRWYGAAVSRLQDLVEVRLAPAIVARGLARFPGDPDLLVARGSFVETRLALAQVDASLASILYPSDIRQRWRDELSEAERDFEHAVQPIGSASEAAVRLSRVHLLKGQHNRGFDLLDRVLAGAPPPVIRYLALLFRAAAAEHTRDLRAAARDYRAAMALIPGAQTPMLALGRLADEQNQPSDARTWIERALAPETRAIDPWRRYIQGQAWQAGERMAGLRTLERR